MTAKKTNRKVGDVAEFAEISTQIDELRAKLKGLVGTTSSGVVENTDRYLGNSISALEDYFEWAGCYDDEPEVKAMSEKEYPKTYTTVCCRSNVTMTHAPNFGYYTGICPDCDHSFDVHEDHVDVMASEMDQEDWDNSILEAEKKVNDESLSRKAWATLNEARGVAGMDLHDVLYKAKLQGVDLTEIEEARRALISAIIKTMNEVEVRKAIRKDVAL